MKLIVGLGNPGRKYVGTRHNIGFVIIDQLAAKHGRGKPKADFQGELIESELEGLRALLLKPQTFMNKSGGSVLAARDFYKILDRDILVVCDDFNLPLGVLRIRPRGSSGGQKGLEDVIRRLGTDEVPRLRVGVGEPTTGYDVADYVLSRFKKEERPAIDEAVWRAADAIGVWSREGIDICMNRYN